MAGKQTVEVRCPDCDSMMHKSGTAWSGKHKVQRYRCQQCGRTTIKTADSNNEEMRQ